MLPSIQSEDDQVISLKEAQKVSGQKQNNQAHPKENGDIGLTYKQHLKQDAMLWAEFLYSEYKREKVLLEEVQTMPTHYDNPTA